MNTTVFVEKNENFRGRNTGQTTTRINKTVAKVKHHVCRKVRDYQHKLTTWLVTEHDAVVMEGLNIAEMLQADRNAQNKQDTAWRQLIILLEYNGELYGTRVVQVDAAGTT